MSPSSSSPPSKSSRVACHQARDLFYACVRDSGTDFKPGESVPRSCTKLRSGFVRACPASWVQHFDEQQEAAARRAKHLHKLIGDQAQSGAGSLSGKAQA